MYSLLEEEDPKVMEVTTAAGSHGSSKASIIDLACSFLHRIVARPRILPYIDMIKWILDSTEKGKLLSAQSPVSPKICKKEH